MARLTRISLQGFMGPYTTKFPFDTQLIWSDVVRPSMPWELMQNLCMSSQGMDGLTTPDHFHWVSKWNLVS